MKRTLALIALATLAAACGSTSQAAAPSPSPAPSSAAPSASASASPSGLTFHMSGINTGASGTILLTKGQGTITLELQITGLAADSQHVSHIHVGDCLPKDQGGIIYALNPVIADGTGAADAKSMVHATYPPANGHWYVVVHAGPDMQGANATYLLCGNLF